VLRAASERLGARDVDLRGGGSPAGGEAPFVLGVRGRAGGVQQVVWIAIDAVGRARLEQQNGACRVFAEAAGEEAAR
jgi:hypothetical protein